MYKLSEKLDAGDTINLGGLALIIDEVRALGFVQYDVELTCHVWVAPSKKIILGLPKEIPIKLEV